MITDSDDAQIQAALTFARTNRRRIAKARTDTRRYPRERNPVSIFMAGSPGAGKTEASIELIDRFPEWKVLRIDADELRQEFPEYTGDNAWVFQSAVSRIVDAILDRAFRQDQSFVLDGTLSNYEVARKNVSRSLQHGRAVQILYVYQRQRLAWRFVQAREAAEGRRILPQDFVRQYFDARQVVNRLKREFDSRVRVDLLVKNNDNSNRFYRAGIDQIDSYVPECVEREDLELWLGTS